MKISKLFHWLYAVLMLLPVFAIGTACLISTFNMNSKEKAVINYKYQKGNALYPYTTSLELNKLYHLDNFDYKDFLVVSDFYSLDMYIVNCDVSYYSVDGPYLDDYYDDIGEDGTFVFTITNDTSNIFNSYSNFTTNIQYNDSNFYFTIGDLFADIVFNSIDFYFVDTNSVDCFLNYYIYPLDIHTLVGSDYNEILSVELVNLDTQSVFYNAVEEVTNNSLFSWAQASFLGVPVSYLGGLFGLASNSFINILLCYWVAVSIIWLMFDVLMFVPILVHKSIDKARF